MNKIDTGFWKKPSRRLVACIAVAGILAIALSAPSCSAGGYSGPVETITIGMEPTAVNSLIYIAQEQGYFQANGLAITIRDDYASGAAASEKMMEGEVDMATTAELFIVRQAFAGEDIVTLASIDNFMHMKLLVRKDRGIQDTSDLKGKRIGVPVKTSADFMLGRFLDLNGVSHNEVTIVDVQAPKAVDAITNGEVDAVVTWQPNVITIQEQLGDEVSVWDVQNGQPMYCVFITTGDLVQSHSDMFDPLLRSLTQAEGYVIRNPDQAKDLIRSRLGYEDTYLNALWPDYQFGLSLDQSLILAMEDEARWMIGNNLTTEKTVPNFLDYIYADALISVKPEAVRIIGR